MTDVLCATEGVLCATEVVFCEEITCTTEGVFSERSSVGQKTLITEACYSTLGATFSKLYIYASYF